MRPIVRFAAALLVIVVTALVFARLHEQKGYGLKTGQTAPTFTLPLLQGGESSLESYRGKFVLVNFWATWCAPCVQEMPSLERLHQVLGPEGLVILGVSTDEDLVQLKRFVAEKGVTFPILRDPGGTVASTSYRTTGYPETFLVSPAGRLEESFVGPARWDTPEAVAHFRERLRSAPTR